MPAVLVTKSYCYAELAVSSQAVAATIASTHYAYSWMDGQAELGWVARISSTISSAYLDG